MTVATPVQPDATAQRGTAYKANIDAAHAVAARFATWFAPHENYAGSPAEPDMTVQLESGWIWNGASVSNVAAQSTGAITAPSGNPRIDLVVVDADSGAVSVVTGSEAASPSAPAIPAGKIPVAQVALTVSQTTIENTDITDIRVFPSPAAASLSEAQAGTETDVRLWSPARIKSAIDALAGTANLLSDMRQAYLRLADLTGDRLNMVAGRADPFKDESDIDTASSTNEVYDAAGDFYAGLTQSTLLTGGLNTDPGSSDTDEHQRVVIDAGQISGTGAEIRITFEAAAATSFVIDDCFIGHAAAAGNAWDFDGNQVRVTFSGGSDGVTIGTGATAASDWIPFTLDDTKDLVISFDVGSLAGNRPRVLLTKTGWQTYNAVTTDAAGDTNPAGLSTDNDVQAVNLVEVREPANLTLVSNAFTADSAPSTGRIYIQVQENESITINTDLIAEISRDDGSNWTTATLALVETLADGTKAYEDAAVDISGQPSDTAMVYRITTANTKDVEIHGVVFQWD